MSRKFRYLFRLLFNFFRIPLLKVFTGRKFKSPVYLLASSRSEFRIEEKGCIFIKKMLNMVLFLLEKAKLNKKLIR